MCCSFCSSASIHALPFMAAPLVCASPLVAAHRALAPRTSVSSLALWHFAAPRFTLCPRLQCLWAMISLSFTRVDTKGFDFPCISIRDAQPENMWMTRMCSYSRTCSRIRAPKCTSILLSPSVRSTFTLRVTVLMKLVSCDVDVASHQFDTRFHCSCSLSHPPTRPSRLAKPPCP